MSDFQKSFSTIVPSTYRGVDGIVESAAVKWEDIAGYNDVKQSLRQVYNHGAIFSLCNFTLVQFYVIDTPCNFNFILVQFCIIDYIL